MNIFRGDAIEKNLQLLFSFIGNIGKSEKKVVKDNWLSNVNVVISDKKLQVDQNNDGVVDWYRADIMAFYDYYSGVGQLMPGREYERDSYKFGAQGSEVDTSIGGDRNTITTFNREGNFELLRWTTIDPKPNASESPYAMNLNNGVLNNDPNGDCPPGVPCTDPLPNMERIRVNRASNLGPGNVRGSGSQFHAGHDLYAPAGTPVMSVMTGDVVAAGYSSSYGNYATIKHQITEMRATGKYTVDPNDPDMVPTPVMKNVITATYYTFYSHLGQSNVQAGDQVGMGQQIGTVGTSGNATGSTGDNVHLHFEIGTALRSANSSFLSSGNLLDPNTGYNSVSFGSANPAANQSMTGVIKTNLYKGLSIMKTKQNYIGSGSTGSDKVIENRGVDMINEAGGVGDSK